MLQLSSAELFLSRATTVFSVGLTFHFDVQNDLVRKNNELIISNDDNNHVILCACENDFSLHRQIKEFEKDSKDPCTGMHRLYSSLFLYRIDVGETTVRY